MNLPKPQWQKSVSYLGTLKNGGSKNLYKQTN